jgi:hypothetical protein
MFDTPYAGWGRWFGCPDLATPICVASKHNSLASKGAFREITLAFEGTPRDRLMRCAAAKLGNP